MEEEGEINDTPIEQVRLVVPITDDPTLPVLTFRTWVLGPVTCILLGIYTQLTGYRQIPVSLPRDLFIWLFIPVGKFMAEKLPSKPIKIPFTKWSFSLNPGPFNMKEHFVLMTLATYSCPTTDIVFRLITIAKIFFHKGISFWGAFLLVQSSQMMGYGITGIYMKYLVNNPYMWWPEALSYVSYYRMLHEVDVRPKGELKGRQFFIIVAVLSFAYYIIPTYFFPSIVALSFVCWIWKDSVTVQQIGSGLHGFGIGSLTLDWSSITAYATDPLIMPMFAVVNIMAGIILVAYILDPFAYYWTNAYGAKRFPLISSDTFDINGQVYNNSRIINDDITFNKQGYNDYSPLYVSIFMLYSIGFGLAAETATLTQFFLHDAREIWNQFKKQRLEGLNQFNDVHNRLMNKYKSIPQWWFIMIIVSSSVLALLNCMFFGKQFQVPYWLVLFGYLLAFICVLPVGFVVGVTGQRTISMKLVSQLIIGWIYPGNPLGSLAFQSYTAATLTNSLNLMSQFKVGHYMKIPPRPMFIAMVVGSFISISANLCTQWWLLTTVDNICDAKKLPEGSPWTCPFEHVELSNTMVWGTVGPTRMFGRHGPYPNMFMFFGVGAISTLVMWVIVRVFPTTKWIKKIHIPLILAATTNMPPATPMHYWACFTIAVFYQGVVYRKYKEWWGKYNYLLAYGLGLGPALFTPIATLALNMEDVYGVKWWGLLLDDHCPLATCPTAPGVKVDGCPVF